MNAQARWVLWIGAIAVYSGVAAAQQQGASTDAAPQKDKAAKPDQIDERIAATQRTLTAPNAELDAAQVKWEASVRGKAPKGLPKEILAALAVDPAKRNAKQKQALLAHYRANLMGVRDDGFINALVRLNGGAAAIPCSTCWSPIAASACWSAPAPPMQRWCRRSASTSAACS